MGWMGMVVLKIKFGCTLPWRCQSLAAWAGSPSSLFQLETFSQKDERLNLKEISANWKPVSDQPLPQLLPRCYERGRCMPAANLVRVWNKHVTLHCVINGTRYGCTKRHIYIEPSRPASWILKQQTSILEWRWRGIVQITALNPHQRWERSSILDMLKLCESPWFVCAPTCILCI